MGGCYSSGNKNGEAKYVADGDKKEPTKIKSDADASGNSFTSISEETTADASPLSDEHDPESQKKQTEYSQTRARRPGVSAESGTQAKMSKFVKPVFDKSEEDREKICKFIKNKDKANLQVLFGHLDQASINDVVAAMYPKYMKCGDSIITQGDQGDAFYIVDSGEYDILVARRQPNGELGIPNKILTMGVGSAFGELALMYNAPRAATVTCITEESRVWVLDREPFQMLLITAENQKKVLYEGWLADVHIFKDLNHYELSQLSDMLNPECFDGDDNIIEQGGVGDKFYILEEGECRAYIQGGDGEKEVKVYNTQGDYFGEIALLTDLPRQSTVRAIGDDGCAVLSCLKEDFIRVLGPIKDLLMKDVAKYPQYKDFLTS